MNLMFWKHKAAAGDSADGSQEKPDDTAVSRKPLGRESRSGDTHGETADAGPVRPKRHLIIVAAIGTLILAATGWAVWIIFLPSTKQNAAVADTPALIQPISLPERHLIQLPPIEFIQSRKSQSKDDQTGIEDLKKKNAALQTQIEALKIEPPQVENPKNARLQAEIETLKKNNDELQAQVGALKAELPQLEKAQAEQHQANIDALAKKNSDLQAQIEALKRKPQQHPSVSPANQAADKAQPPARSGDIAIASKNSKATAMTLKEAIEAMNANSGIPPKKTAK